jgi:hypothetical protein
MKGCGLFDRENERNPNSVWSLYSAGLISIVETPANPSISLGDSQRFIATGTFSDDSTQRLVSVNWSSSRTAVAAISNDNHHCHSRLDQRVNHGHGGRGY